MQLANGYTLQIYMYINAFYYGRRHINFLADRLRKKTMYSQFNNYLQLRVSNDCGDLAITVVTTFICQSTVQIYFLIYLYIFIYLFIYIYILTYFLHRFSS